ncbi:Ppx-GppA-domain-containing protein [Mytilinidion resinicola]|uniref:Ppx-GppA-domain-containing protein n=1 Tax=Mytilinidion resinicola TaxID=574789 RepID=A0A6A6Y1S5_9PEZI|nr:Ppx-GppA-domain-containing protein [Mytilinidion resinicola]KAF2801964.1 Ppx-GppA-domain-containing protein [Mytilinidion resinicola]
MGNSENPDYYGLVDMGSNGIRFSITSLAPQTRRILPTIYVDRAAISLYDAQYPPGTSTRVPISASTITAVIHSILRFKSTCTDYGVPPSQIRLLATEATRTAPNSSAFRDQIHDETGWTVELLPKEEEGRIGAYGVASSYSAVHGLVMDLGGGSTQLTWLTTSSGEIQMSPKGSISMPYGAAALTRELSSASSHAAYREKVTADLKSAVASLAIPPALLHAPAGLALYLSGGGFRGWGFVLMAAHAITPYPIPIINGLHVTTAAFHDTAAVTAAVQLASADSTPAIFRVSARRASQVPAVAFLVSCLADALPAINHVYFAQGGVREGMHFASLTPSERAADPLVVATRDHAPPDVGELVALLQAAAPGSPLPAAMITAFAQALYAHAALPKDICAGAALRATTTGAWAGTHGVSHEERAVLALLLCERHGGMSRISPSEQEFYGRIVRLAPEGWAWWCMYVGRVAGVVASVYPAGVVPRGYPGGAAVRQRRLVVRAAWGYGKGKSVLGVDFGVEGVAGWDEGFQKAVKGVEKVGKRKNWVGGWTGWKVDVTVDGEAFEG